MHIKRRTDEQTETLSVPSFEEFFDILRIQSIQDAFARSEMITRKKQK